MPRKSLSSCTETEVQRSDMKASSKTEYGYTALHTAVISRDLDAVGSQAGKHCDLESRDAMGFTALHLATLQGSKEVVEALVRAGCDVNSRTKEGMTSLHVCAERQGAEGIISILVSSSCDVNVRNKLGRTALHLAAKLGNLGHLKALLDAGCDRHIKDKLGFTPVGLAFKFNQKESADILLHYKARRGRYCNKDGLWNERLATDAEITDNFVTCVCSQSEEENLEYSCCKCKNGQLTSDRLESNRVNGAISSSSEKNCNSVLKIWDSTMSQLKRANPNKSNDLASKIPCLLAAILTQKTNTLDGLTPTSGNIQFAWSNFEKEALRLILASLSSITVSFPSLPTVSSFPSLPTVSVAASGVKPRHRCVSDPQITFGRKIRAFQTSLLIKLLSNLKHSLNFSQSGTASSFQSRRCFSLPLNWRPKEQEVTVNDLEAFAQIFANVCNEASDDPKALQKLLDRSFSYVFANDIFDSGALVCSILKNSKVTLVNDSKTNSNDFDGEETSANDQGSCFSGLEHVTSMNYSSPSFAEALLQALLQEPNLLHACLGQRSSFLNTILSKIFRHESPWMADKIAKIFLQICVALASDQPLLHQYANYVMRQGLLHQQCNAMSLGTCILIRMGLLKGEEIVDVVEDLKGPIIALERLFTEEYFPRELAAVFASFLCKSSPRLFKLEKLRLQALASAVTKEVLPMSTEEAGSDVGKSYKRICDIVAFETDWELFVDCVDALFSRVFLTLKCNPWRVGESVLVSLGLLKSEFQIETARDLGTALKLLDHVVKQCYFPTSLKHMFVLFLQKQNPDLKSCCAELNKVLSTLRKI